MKHGRSPFDSAEIAETGFAIELAIGESALHAVVSGELDVRSGSRLDEAIEPFIERPQREFQFDLSGVSFIDSGGAASLVRIATGLEEAGVRVNTVGWSHEVERIFRLLRTPIPGARIDMSTTQG